MRIKTRIQLGIILSLILAATIALLIFLAARTVNETSRLEGIAAEAVKGVAELKIITHEYLLHPEERSLMQWRSKYDSLSKLLAGGYFKNPDEKIVADQIFKNLERFKTVFSDLATGLRKRQALGKQKSSAFRELQDRLMGELLVKSQLAVSLAFQLHQNIDAKSVKIQKRASFLTLFLLLTLTAAIVGISLWVNRSIARPIAKLEKDTQIIGSGNLDHKVGTPAKDEIGQLSRAFDRMTVDLKHSTASVDKLNQEIDDRKQSEARLKESENRFRAQYQGSPTATFTWQRREDDFVLIDCNRAAVEMTDGRSEEYLGRSANEMYGKRLEIQEDLNRSLREETVITKELMSRDFVLGRYILTTYAPVPPDLVMVHVRDMTERREFEAAIQESETQKRAILDASIDRIRLVDRDLRIIWANKTTTRELNIAPEELEGKICHEFFVERDAPCPGCPMIKALKSGKVEHAVIHQSKMKGFPGDTYWDIYATPIKDESGHIVNLIEVSRNITERKRAEEEKEALETQLQQAQKMEAIGTLAGGIAHDFNNILGGILGYAELAKMKAPEESNIIADLDKLIKSSNRAADLIKQILTISRHHKKEQRPVQARYIVKEVLNLLRATLPTTIEIQEDLAKDTGIVNADPTQMHQVIMNLGINAGHAMQEDGGVLEVSLANVELDDLEVSKHLDLNAGSYLRLTLSDTGRGMTSEIMERIFDPYFTTKDTGEGTGLGLSVAQGIIKAHGGTITVYSKPGKGTTFNVYLPIIHETEEAEKEESKEPLPFGSERILFIDDEQALVEIGSKMLEQLGYEVVTKQSSIEALELFRAEPDRFDLVITDMTMPDMTGDKLAQELIKIRPDIPVIICTGYSKRISEEKARNLGIRKFVMKPLMMRNLAETVRKALD